MVGGVPEAGPEDTKPMSRLRIERLMVLVCLWALLGAGCVQDYPPAELEPAGSARVVLVLPRSMALQPVTQVTVSAAGAEGASFSTELTGEGGVWQGVLRGLPSGEYAIEARAFDSGGSVLYAEESPVAVLSPLRPALIVLVEQAPLSAGSPGELAPRIRAVIGSTAVVAPGGTVSFRAQVSPASASQVPLYEWQADGGTFDDPRAATPVWTAPPEAGRRTLRLVVRDAGGATASLSFTVDVAGGRQVSADGPVVFNRWPTGEGLRALPSKSVSIGQQVTAEVRGTDPDGDALTYRWSADCEGALTDSSSATAGFTPSALPRETACDNCRLVVDIEDAYGGRASHELGLCVGDPQPPTIVSFSPAAPASIPGEVLKLRVEAATAQGGQLAFAWNVSTGTLGVPVQAGNVSEVPWTVLSCVPPGVQPSVEVTVTNSAGLSTLHRFDVAWTGPVCGHPPCEVRLAQEVLTQQADCTTDTPVFIPDEHTFNGAGHTLTAVDPSGGHFTGAILRNRGTTAHVSGLKLRAQRLLKSGPCDGGDARLRGILLQGASGSVVDSEVTGIYRNQTSGGDPDGVPRGCIEGHAIEVRNSGSSTVREVQVLRNRVSGYQRVGVLVIGLVNATVTGNVLDGGGPVGHIARTGVQLSDGATGRVADNQVSGHSYTGADVATGILLAGGPFYNLALVREAVIEGNTLTDNDIGIYLSQAEADGSGPVNPTLNRVVGNTLRSDAVTNGYVFQAAIADFGGGNLISSNLISGIGYDPATQPDATFDVDVVADTASQVVFLSPAAAVAAGSCSGRVLVQSQDAKGNLVNPAQPTFTLTASGAAASGLLFYADAACTQPITTVELSSPQAEAAFHFKAVQAGTASLSVSNGSLSGSQERTIGGP
jgi:hypothetical protein